MAEALVIQNLSKRFGGLRAVQDVSFSVREGETLALIGPNGAGKTTSFNLITGFFRPDTGSITAFGREIVGLRPHDICAHGLARTFQVAKPFGAMTVLANVMTGAFLRDKRIEAAREKAREAIEFVGLSAKESTNARDLTTIDQRRLEMARALATEPRLLLLDEVMAGLNPSEIAELVPLVRAIRDSGVTLLLTEHVMQAVMGLAEQVYVLNNGRIIADGPPAAIVADARVIEAYLGHGAAARLKDAHA
jgi:branched-chain amino acid transport system ATP-binding protein